ncbi:FtsX-like permease family protein [compost metagenome]
MTQSEVRKMIVLESLFYGLIAAAIGIIVGIVLDYGIHDLYAGAIDKGIPWYSIGIALAGAMMTTLIATVWPMHRINKISIVDSLRKEN